MNLGTNMNEAKKKKNLFSLIQLAQLVFLINPGTTLVTQYRVA